MWKLGLTSGSEVSSSLPIASRRAPDDFPDGLPSLPPTTAETYQLCELWDNLRGIARLDYSQWGATRRCKYMVWTLTDGRQFRVIWDAEKGEFTVHQRRTPGSVSK